MRPYGGTNPLLNRREYVLARAMQSTIESLAGSVNVHEDSVTAALADFDDRRGILAGPHFRLIIQHATVLTVQDGTHDARHLLAQKGVQHPKRSLGAKAAPKPIAPYTPPAPGKSQPWGTLVDKMTDHTVDHFNRIADDFKDRLKDTLKEGYSAGEGAPGLRDRVQDALGVDSRRAAERARTLTMETYNQAHLVQYNEAGIPGTQVLAANDERMCEICGDLDGTVFALDDPDLMWPPFHNFCRCTMLPVINDLPEDAGHVSDDTRTFYDDWSAKYFDIPLYA
jgi:SPP1 gp7 family putative phage head morphogenesis protein